jgi:hypothetical protein
MQVLRSVGLFVASALVITSTHVASAADFPKGEFTRKGPDGAVWSVTIDGKGKFTVTRDGMAGVEGTYKVTKDEIEFTDEKGPFAEKGAAKTGTHKWKLADKKVTFTKVKDDSKGRAGILNSGPWAPKE